MRRNYEFSNRCIILLICFVPLTSFIQSNKSVIEWDKFYKLTWDDFEGKPDKSNEHGTLSTVGIEFKEMVWNKKNAHGKLKTFFYKTQSWTKSRGSELLLKHEQGHFDIAEIYARQLRKEFNNKRFKKNTVSKEMEKTEQEKNNYQNLYDNETDHGKNSEINKEWEDKIQKQLQELDKYSTQEITIKL